MTITIHVFGKPGCEKCKLLNERIDNLVRKDEYSMFTKEYHDCMTEDGLVQFCLAQNLNPSNIPAMLFSVEKNTFLCKPESYDIERHDVYGKYGVQTDWSNEGMHGDIPVSLIKKTLDEVKEHFKCTRNQ